MKNKGANTTLLGSLANIFHRPAKPAPVVRQHECEYCSTFDWPSYLNCAINDKCKHELK